MVGFSVPFILFGLFIAFVDVQGADHYEGRTRLSRRSTDTELKNKLDSIVSMLGKLNDKIDSQEQRIAALSRQVGNINCNGQQSKVPRDCADVYKSGRHGNGIYTIDPDGEGSMEVFCDQTTDGGGWTVFQRRLDGSVDFYREWKEYKEGFGTAGGEYWLGLDNINRLTNQGRMMLRVDLNGKMLQSAHALYRDFTVSNEKLNYTLGIGSYTGTAGDSLSWHNDMQFTTRDRDHDNSADGNCAEFYKGAWWYNACLSSNLNGVYYRNQQTSYADGVNWKTWGGLYYSASRAEMKLRPMGFNGRL
ncbi:microfibril-associated glycoprotein 4-like [Orbicella faveolata]|uniref:microfibril-associated glycoprotein 4-like n=1 Tax=Orbicella faveolata TaxID=48498 RepID=UPI0009E1F5AA|nr:microfibril-associated glycoprotein 4-like [Orbicella faveolata]